MCYIISCLSLMHTMPDSVSPLVRVLGAFKAKAVFASKSIALSNECGRAV